MFYSLAGEQIILIVMVVALVLVLVVMPIFTNKKRQQSVSMLHSSLKVGDKIMTIGGIIGTVKAINQTSPVDREIVIETGVEPNKTTMIMDIKALYQIVPPIPAGFVQNNVNSTNATDVFEDVQKPEAEVKVTQEATPVVEEPVEQQIEEVAEEVAPVEKTETTAAKPRTTTAKKTNSTKK